MPLYTFECAKHHRIECYLSVKDMEVKVRSRNVRCNYCGLMSRLIITAPLLVKVAADVCYDSPIDGAPITTRQAREEDLKRHECHAYDPGVKTDYDHRRAREDAELDAAMDATVEEAIEKMPTATRGKLYSELTEQGVDVHYTRTTPHA